MNAPLPDSVRAALASLTLDDKYALDRGRAFMSGVQALVKLPMLQQVRDARAGLNTAGFVSGYRGSPLGGYDQALWKAREHLQAHHVVFQPGVNEELAATAVWGTQQLALYPDEQRFDGVFGLWYGKGPGVDRSADALKHANMAGTARHGGVIAVAGDDHAAKSSSVAHQSDHLFKACGLPVFFPSSVQDILDLGLHAWALSRFSGLWAGLKTIQEVVESSSTVEVDPDRVRIVLPTDFDMPAEGLHIRWPDTPLAQEARLMDFKWYAALAYVRANRLNHTVLDSPDARLGLMASGKAWNDLRQALVDLGLDDAACRALGLRLHKVNVVWPLEASITREFATGLQEILVVEEKRQMIEYQLKEELYNWREDVRPNVLGKFNEPEGDRSGGEWSRSNPGLNWLLRAKADLNPALIARAVAQRLERLGLLQRLDADGRARVARRLADIEAKEPQALSVHTPATTAPLAERQPWFCSGCPHNTSTRVPEGSRALAGIGCHYMALWMDRRTTTVSQMGGEGVAWVGQAPFSQRPHVFANLGDGTYFHSGFLAVRQSIAAGVNITYKILVNDAVAMTGGQPIDGQLSVAAMSRELHAEGVSRLMVVSDEPEKYAHALHELAPGTTVHHRDELDALQRTLRALKGCSVMIYDQTCATEKRRRRKRGTVPQATTHVLIHEGVCEGCGDCSVQSNCLSVEPVETPLGRKRRINQSTCNQDLSCVKGFCPSLVTVQGGRLKKPPAARPDRAEGGPPDVALPAPVLPDCTRPWGIVVAGIGGTGVITLGQLLGVAAHLEGKGIVTQDSAGLAQKGGATWSHVQIAQHAQAICTTRVATAEADLLLACDALVAAHETSLSTLSAGRTHVALNTHASPTASFVHDGQWQYPAAACHAQIQATSQADLGAFDAHALASAVLGDSLFANPMLLGFAWQKGWVPLSREALFQAMALNGVKVAQNQAAFEWGRWAAHDLPAAQRAALPATPIAFVPRRTAVAGAAGSDDFHALVEHRQQRLQTYQNRALAERYTQRMQHLQALAHAAGVASDRRVNTLLLTVAREWFRLLAVKDEYEVARLLTDPAFLKSVGETFEGEVQLAYHLAPPALGTGDAGHRPAKRRVVAHRVVRWGLSALARLKFLRHTPFDVFAHSAERRQERAWADRYRLWLDELAQSMSHWGDATTLAREIDRALGLAAVPEAIRGFGPVRQQAMAQALERWQALCATGPGKGSE